MNPFFDQAQLFTKLWMDFATKMATAGLHQDPEAAPTQAARDYRGAAFDAMSSFFDQYMRSPQALDMMKQSMDMAVGFRKQWNDMLTRMHHEMQGTAKQDIDNLLRSTRHLETRVLDCMEQLSDRLDAIARRLDAIEAGESHHGNGEAAPSAGRTVRRSTREKSERIEE